MKEDDNPYEIESPWGAVAGFFLIQCFGYVTLQGFRMFLNIGVRGSDGLSLFNAINFVDRVFLPFWGMVWIFAFVAFQVEAFRRISRFLGRSGPFSLIRALKAPWEVVKALVAVLFGAIYLAFLFGHYPFPSRPISITISILFGLFGWGVSALIAWRFRGVYANQERTGGRAGAIMGFLVGAVFFAIAYFVQPGLFYFHGMIGLGVMTMTVCQVLFKAGRTKRC